MAPLLEEEEEIVVVEPAEPEIGLGLGVIDEPDEEVIDEDEADTPRRPEED
jgi:hypothetical protein